MKLLGQEIINLPSLIVKKLRGVINLLPAVLILSFYIFAASGVTPDEGRKVMFLISGIVLTTHMYLHSNILKVLVYYCVLNLFLTKSNAYSFTYLLTIWSLTMFSSFIYRVNRDFKYWGWALISIYLLSLYCILAVRFGWWNLYYPLTNIRHVHYIEYAGAFTHTIYQGIYSAILVPISLVIAPVLIIPQLVTLYLAHCSVGVFALLFALTLYVLRVRLKLGLLLTPIFLFIFYLYADKYDGAGIFGLLGQQRIIFWTKLLQYEGFSLLGKGLGSFHFIRGVIPAVNPYDIAEFANAHNFLVQWYYQTGFIGLILFISYPIYISYRYFSTHCSMIEHALYMSCLTSFICAMWQPSFSVVEIGVPSILLVTLLERSLNHGKVERESEVEYKFSGGLNYRSPEPEETCCTA